MKKIFFTFAFLLLPFALDAATDNFLSCGPGFIMSKSSKVDGIEMIECQKLWCRDLEAGKNMGTSDRAASGYEMTKSPIELCDASGNCVECYGERRWCSGEAVGRWNPEYGAYTRGGNDTATYESYQRGSCFVWRLEKPKCGDDETAILQNGEWVCVVSTGDVGGVSRESAIRRTGGSIRRLSPIR